MTLRPSRALLGLSAVAAAGWLAALGAGQLLADVAAPVQLPAAGELAAEAPSLAVSRAADAADYVAPVVARDIFGAAASAPPPGDGPVSETTLQVVLLATLVVEPAGASSALLADAPGRPSRGLGVGDIISEDAVLIAIDPRSIRIRRADGRVESVALTTGRPLAGASTGAADSPGGDVVRLGPDRYAVPRGLVDRITENPAALAKHAHAVPHEGPDGQVDGYRLSGIRRASLLGQLGVRNGDVVHALDGAPLDSADAALRAFSSLSSGSSFSLALTRRTRTRTLTFEVR